jgi:hypothetical protein
VAIDPAVTSGDAADETGIVVAGKDKDAVGRGVPRRLASKHPLQQERSRFGDPACAGKTGAQAQGTPS